MPFQAFNRRDGLKLAAGMALSTGGLFSQEQTEQTDSCHWRWKLSPAVLKAVAGDTKTVAAGVIHKNLTSADVRKLGKSFEIYAADLDGVGALPDMENAIKKSGALDTEPTREHLNSVRKLVQERSGTKISDDAFDDFCSHYHDHWPKLKTMVEGGIKSVHSRIVHDLDKWADKIEQDERDGNLAANADGGRMVKARIEPAPWDFCAAMAVMGLYFGTWGFMGWLGYAAFAGPVAVGVFAIAGLALAVGGMFCL
jgi:hypothetical protein